MRSSISQPYRYSHVHKGSRSMCKSYYQKSQFEQIALNSSALWCPFNFVIIHLLTKFRATLKAYLGPCCFCLGAFLAIIVKGI